jgi:peptidyl-tRNA hydrolase, PTH1 family
MKIIIGLGNPGKEYEKTRHNTGFMILDELRKLWNFPEFSVNQKFNAEVSESLAVDEKIMLIRPQTFMNNSGESVKKILDFYKLTPDDILVIHDDLDIESGKYKIATDSSSAGHNGVQNIIDQLGTQKFRRARVGIGKITTDTPACRLGAHDYVLDKFSEEELEKVKKLSKDIEAEIQNFL